MGDTWNRFPSNVINTNTWGISESRLTSIWLKKIEHSLLKKTEYSLHEELPSMWQQAYGSYPDFLRVLVFYRMDATREKYGTTDLCIR